jgi:hypothetical protein
MNTRTLPKGTVVTLLASYCQGDDCTDKEPCRECLKMCNIFEITNDVVADYKGQVDEDV